MPSGSKEVRAFASKLRAERQQRGMSQEALGQASGITSSEISRIERGVREPRLVTIFRLARGLDMTPAELFDGLR
jgi:transcriptional regulator with XRE-family HTH domain